MIVRTVIMQNHFEIDYQGLQTAVEYQRNQKENEYMFTIQLPEGPVKLQCQKDNEGAYKWLEDDDSASARASDIGVTIEKYLMENHIDL